MEENKNEKIKLVRNKKFEKEAAKEVLEKQEAALYKKLTGSIKEKLLIKVIRGIYATPDASLEEISTRINPESYISTGTVLAKNLIIGSVPARKVQAVKLGRPRVYEFEFGVIEHLSISPTMFFGFESLKGIKYAIPEKAFIDTCYYYFKGKNFSFDPESDINMEFLDKKLISEYLKNYDKRFRTFFKRIWGYE